MSDKNAQNKHTNKHSFVDDMADEYRADTLTRLARVSLTLDELARAGAPDEDLLGEIKSHAHSIKGASKTFGFTGLSVVAHAMDDFLRNLDLDGGLVFLDDLERLNNLMISVTSASDIISQKTGEKMLSDLDLPMDNHGKGTHAKGQAIALLIMARGDERNAMARTLEILGLGVLTARDGVQAIELATVRRPDIIITTLHSDRLSAPELVQVFAEINATASIPTLVMLPEVDKKAGSTSKDAIALLTSELPPSVHKIKQGAKLNQQLSAKLVELGVISL